MQTIDRTAILALAAAHPEAASRWACSRPLMQRLRQARDAEGNGLARHVARDHRQVLEMFGLPMSTGQGIDDTTLLLLDAAGAELGRCML